MKSTTFVLSMLWLLLMAIPAVGQNHIIQSPHLQSLKGAVYVLPEGPQRLSPEAAASRDFTPLAELSDQLQGMKDYWLKLNITNQLSTTSDREWVLQFPQSLSRIEVFLKDEQGFSDPRRTGFFVPLEERSFAPTLKANLVRFILLPGGQQEVLVRARSDRSSIPPKFDLQLESDQHFFDRLQRKKQINSLFIGFCLMMLIYTLILYIYSRDKTYFYYALYLIGIGVYVDYVNGNFHDLVIPVWLADHPQYIYLTKLITYFALIGYMSFFRSFLDLKVLLPRWDWFFQWLCWLALPAFLLDLYLMLTTNFSYVIADRVTIFYSLVFVIASFLFTIALYRTHDRKGYFVIGGLTFMGLGVLFTALDRVRTVDYSVLYFEIGGTIELVIFSIGLAYRQQAIRRERQRARFELEKNQLLQQQEQAEIRRQKEMMQLKTELYTNITHELRTPLTVIMGMTGQIQGHPKEKELINRNTTTLLRLVKQVMDLSQLEAGRMPLRLKQADIIPFLRYLCESFHSNARARQIQLHFRTDLEELHMDFDDDKIQQIVYNLLSNALKFTGEGGTITVEVARKTYEGREALELMVEDTGEGIAESEIPQIFDRFFQSRLHHHQKFGGSGIGLALTKQLVELMEGQITVESPQQKGTTFRVLLPIRRQAPVEAPKMKSIASLPADVPVPVTSSGDSELPQVLVIEDNPDVIAYIEICLEGHFRISKADKGETGLALAFEQIPDLIISDVMMPGMSGYELCEQLKIDIRTSHIPIILLTARADQEGRLTGLRQGADAYLTKPFDREELLIRIRQLISLRKTLQQHFLRTGLMSRPRTEATQDPEAAFLHKIRQTVVQQLNNPDLEVEDLGKAVQLGHTQLYRKVKALTGLTPIKLIHNIRLEHASQLLLNGQLTVAEVAYEVGFNDPNYFSRKFQQQFGYPPSEHRERQATTGG